MPDNKSKKEFSISQIKKNIKKLDATYTHERKIQFLLDIRGYIKINKIFGNYLEFGSFLSEMQVASYYILKDIEAISCFFGIDIFKKFQGFNSEYEKVKKKLNPISNKLQLIKLDLTKKENLKKINFPLSVSVIDCNEKKCLINSLEHSIKNIINGGVIYIDDYFVLDKNSLILKPYLKKLLNKYGKKYEYFNTYPPFGIAIIVLKK